MVYSYRTTIHRYIALFNVIVMNYHHFPVLRLCTISYCCLASARQHTILDMFNHSTQSFAPIYVLSRSRSRVCLSIFRAKSRASSQFLNVGERRGENVRVNTLCARRFPSMCPYKFYNFQSNSVK